MATAAAVPVLMASHDYRLFFSTTPPILVAVVGAAAWTLVNLLGAAFIAARRAGRFLSIQTLVSTAKVLFVLPLAAAGAGAMGVVEAWVASAVLGVGVGAAGSYRGWGSAADLAFARVAGRLLGLISACAGIGVLVIDGLLLRPALVLCAICWAST